MEKKAESSDSEENHVGKEECKDPGYLSTVKVIGITRNITTTHLKEIFSSIGAVTAIEIPTNPATAKHMNYALVHYTTAESKEKAIKLMNGGQIDGLKIKVEDSVVNEEEKTEKKDTHESHSKKPKSTKKSRERSRSRNSSSSRSSDSGSISSSQSIISSQSSSSSSLTK